MPSQVYRVSLFELEWILPGRFMWHLCPEQFTLFWIKNWANSCWMMHLRLQLNFTGIHSYYEQAQIRRLPWQANASESPFIRFSASWRPSLSWRWRACSCSSGTYQSCGKSQRSTLWVFVPRPKSFLLWLWCLRKNVHVFGFGMSRQLPLFSLAADLDRRLLGDCVPRCGFGFIYWCWILTLDCHIQNAKVRTFIFKMFEMPTWIWELLTLWCFYWREVTVYFKTESEVPFSGTFSRNRQKNHRQFLSALHFAASKWLHSIFACNLARLPIGSILTSWERCH